MTATYVFQSIIYPTRDRMLTAIAEAWIGAGHEVTPQALADCADLTDDQLALACIADWGLDRPQGEYEDEPSHMQACGYTIVDMAAAIGQLRAAHAGDDEPLAVASIEHNDGPGAGRVALVLVQPEPGGPFAFVWQAQAAGEAPYLTDVGGDTAEAAVAAARRAWAGPWDFRLQGSE